MASSIDDLRYISRYGYRDPWAETANKITDSLLAYAQSKNKRDTLLAQIEKENKRDAATDDYRNKSLAIDLYKSTPDEYKGDVIPSLQDAFAGDMNMTPVLESAKETSDKAKVYSDTYENFFDMTKDPKLPWEQRLESARSMFEMANNPNHRAQASSLVTYYGNKVLTDKAKTSYKQLGDINKIYLGTEYPNYIAAVDDENFTGATQILNAQVNKTGKSIQAISSIYDALVERVKDAEEAAAKGEGYPNAVQNAQNALLNETKVLQSYLPKQYQNIPFADALKAALINTEVSTEEKNKLSQKKKDGEVQPKTQTQYTPMDDVSEADMQLPSTGVFQLTNPNDNKKYPQSFKGENARRMIEQGMGEIDKESAYTELSWHLTDKPFAVMSMSYESLDKPSRFTPAGQANRNIRKRLVSGDTVMDKTTLKRYPVIVDVPPGTSTSELQNKTIYIVNGVKYNWKDFGTKFGKPMYEAQEADARNQTDALMRVVQNQVNSFKIHSIQAIPE
tara:strand:- start:730 stop:2247 length:1518 start_codon:yes stop_codon:yes gene_type:complete